MLPVGGKPVIQHAVEEAAAAGVDDMLVVTTPGRHAVEDHFCGLPGMPSMHYVRQQNADGLGNAVLLAADHVGSEPFAVLLADEIMAGMSPLPAMMKVREEHGGSVIALVQVAPERLTGLGCAALQPDIRDGVAVVTGLVEKPARGEAPSAWAVTGRYLCDPAVFDVLRDTAPGYNNEVQLTDALNVLAGRGGLRAVLWPHAPLDAGTHLGRAQAEVVMACRNGAAAGFVPWLRTHLELADL